ncbi:cardiolipin synthase ClsB [Pseudomonas sp. GD03944]|uniref:cardiolipin synthase ClsB n=1 Tax=Pseudomonas sp. GD03944 TaxID=2975409 RepID=UPI0024468485|nr:cardiolipin synthase ClsB [Pseudomonas sp. GD03944]MDH1263500.1 cardiolipin synthase ClsB [Pseudomonas sp. GD03944]
MSGVWRDGNQIELLINGEEYYPRVFERIRAARVEVLLETFIIFEDKVGMELQAVLIEAAKRGVRVVIAVDGYGTADLGKEYVAALTREGVKVHVFDPSPRRLGMRTNLFRRLHRKIVVIDGERAFVGGINYSADHLGDFGEMAKQDYAVEVTGPIVADLHTCTLRLLRPALAEPSPVQATTRATGEVRIMLLERDNDRHTTDIEEQYVTALRNAKERVVVANAYFFPSYSVLRELRNAARRGVKVVLILQGQPDMQWAQGFSRLLYNYLLRDGVVIYEYCQRPLHGKVALVDHEWSTVGSSNLDPLSLALNLEANLFVRDRDFNQQLHEHLEQLAAEHCKRFQLERLLRGYWWRAPLVFLCFHFVRLFPAIAGWLPAHRKNLQPLDPTPGPEPEPKPDPIVESVTKPCCYKEEKTG